MQNRIFKEPAAEVEDDRTVGDASDVENVVDAEIVEFDDLNTTEGRVLRPTFVFALGLLALLVCVLGLVGQMFISSNTYRSEEFGSVMDVNGEVQMYNEKIEEHIKIVREMDEKLSKSFHEPLDEAKLAKIAQTDEFNALKISADEILMQAESFERNAELVWRDVGDRDIKREEYRRVSMEAVNIYLKWSGKSVEQRIHQEQQITEENQ